MTIDPQALFKKYGTEKVRYAVEAEQCERDFSTFLRRAWPNFDASRYQHGWHADAISDHVMACIDGDIRKLLITVPPRCAKTISCTIALPAWVWTLKPNPRYPLHGPTAQFLCVAYNTIRAKEDAVTSRRLIGSPWYQDRWGHRVKIATDRDNAERFDTSMGGSRISTGIDATVLGRGGNIKIIDDAMKPDEPESELVRTSVMRAYDEVLSSRENDPRIACEIIIAQRLAEFDLPGHVLTKYGSDPDNGGFCHLMIPAEYDWQRHCHTVIGWQDPRGSYVDDDGAIQTMEPRERAKHDGESFWPSRFTPEVLEQRKTAEGPWSWSAKYQQAPVPRGGGIIKDMWWKLWRAEAFPAFKMVLVSVDTAHTAEEQNDESGITVWGIFEGDEGVPDFEGRRGQPLLMLINAWEGRLEFNRLVQQVGEMCKKHNADVCLIEGKANGIDVINEIRRLHGKRDWATVQFDPKGDKVSRLTSVQALFSGEYKKDPVTGISDWRGGIVYAPDKDYAQLVIDRVAAFTGGRMRALALIDTTSQALAWLRTHGHLLTAEEHDDDIEEELRYKKPRRPVYDV